LIFNDIARWASCHVLGRAEQMQGLVALDEVQLGERQDLLAIELGLEAELVSGERLDRAKAGRLQRHRD
jgi:hypothetical protein